MVFRILLRVLLAAALVIPAMNLTMSPAAASCGHRCMYRVFNRTTDPLRVTMTFPDGHRCEEVVQPQRNMYCIRNSYVPQGQRYAVMYAPNRIFASHNDQLMRGNCQWTGDRIRENDWKIINPSHKWPCQIVNSYW